MAPGQEIPQCHALFSGDAPRTNQSIDFRCALHDHGSLAGEVGMASDQARRLLEPLEMIKSVHEKLLTEHSEFKFPHHQTNTNGAVDVGC